LIKAIEWLVSDDFSPPMKGKSLDLIISTLIEELEELDLLIDQLLREKEELCGKTEFLERSLGRGKMSIKGKIA